MNKQVFLNLPVADLPKSIAFYEALGYARKKWEKTPATEFRVRVARASGRLVSASRRDELLLLAERAEKRQRDGRVLFLFPSDYFGTRVQTFPGRLSSRRHGQRIARGFG